MFSTSLHTSTALDEDDRWTPIHHASAEDQLEVAAFLIEEDSKISKENSSSNVAPLYNLVDDKGWNSAFLAASSGSEKVLDFLLNIDDLEVVTCNGFPLLWALTRWRDVTPKMAQRLSGQLGQRWRGTLPLDEALDMNNVQSCTSLIMGLDYCSPDVRAMNLRVLMSSRLKDSILGDTGDLILSWIGEQVTHDMGTGLSEQESYSLMANIMRVKENSDWFDGEREGA